ncbi:Fc receptor-like protein 6 [Pseudophryne corroboree]|uniref:Fc receptor-like protein 6 n=1 Tax=Pseudophryne corroboree TaxID=495146 RepID=UPI0030819A7F
MPWIENFLIVLLFGSPAMVHIEAQCRATLQLDPENPIYIEDEAITLRCVADNPSTISQYKFYKDGKVTSDSYNSMNKLFISSLTTSDSGNYFCTCTREGVNMSFESNLINLKVFERPPSASLSVEPQGKVFMKKQSVRIRCLIPEEQDPSEVYLYQNGGVIREADNFGVLTINTETKNSGNYSCGYKSVISGRVVESYPGNQQTLLVIDQPPTPILRNAYRSQSPGGLVELVCDVQNPSFPPGYRFYRNGRELVTNQQVNYLVLNYTLDFDGCYFCQTFAKILGEEIQSPRSSEHFLVLEERNIKDNRGCQDSSGLSKQGIMLYGSVLAGKLLVLICLLLIFGIHHLLIRQRSQKLDTDI